jgi:peptidoglycan/xylan/chitin deacetylase (PgdA/CDA1 family)
MRIVTPVLKRVVYPALSTAGIFHRTSASGLAVLTYHGVKPPGYEVVDAAFDGNLISVEMLRQQLRLLKRYYNVISPAEFLDWRERNRTLPERAVLLTCDDGLRNCLTDMLPVLQQESVKCLFFVTGASAQEVRSMLWYEDLFLLLFSAPDGPFEIAANGIVIRGELSTRHQRRAIWWDSVKRLSQTVAADRRSFLAAAWDHFRLNAKPDLRDENSPSCRRYGLLSASELRKLVAAGMTVGAHTMSHPMLSQMQSDLAYAEIAESRVKLESALGQRIWGFAYPFGDPQSITPQVLEMAEQARFEAAFVNFGGGLGASLPAYALPRIHVTAEMNLAEFEAQVCGFYEKLQRFVRRGSEAVKIPEAAAIQ